MQASRGTPQDLARASGRFGQDFSTFLEAGVEMAGQAPVQRAEGLVESKVGCSGSGSAPSSFISSLVDQNNVCLPFNRARRTEPRWCPT